jgi:hypothetical protein
VEKVINNVGKNGKKWSKVGINSIFLPSIKKNTT